MDNTRLKLTRRESLLGGLLGFGWLGLRSLATGLPVSFLLNPSRAMASGTCAASVQAQYLILSTSFLGDPVNTNAPGTYTNASVVHPADPSMAGTPLTLGGQTYTAAQPWSTLTSLDRTCFFHHSTLTNNHANEPKVLNLMGAILRQEMLSTVYCQALAPCFNTVQTQPVSVGATNASELLSYQGRSLPNLTPLELKAVLAAPSGPLAALRTLRDSDLNRLNTLLKQTGTPEQQQFLDDMANTQSEVRNISQALLSSLNGITANDPANQVIAASALIKMNVTPVVTLHIPFGGDNHGDLGLAAETSQTVSGVATINALLSQLAIFGIQDKCTFAMMNVFGRTLSPRTPNPIGREHLANHHVTVMIGKNVKSSVIGGIEPNGNDFKATGIDSVTGASNDSGDIPFAQTLGAVGKTLGAALGISTAALDSAISLGKVVTAAIQ